MTLLQQIDRLIENVIIDYLKENLSNAIRIFKIDAQVHLNIVDSPYMLGRVRENSDDSFSIEISTGWLRRLALLYCLVDEFWNKFIHQKKINTADIGTAFDSYFLYENIEPDCIFSYCKPLKDLFLDNFEEDYLRDSIENIVDKFNDNQTMENIPRKVGLKFPENVSEKAGCDFMIGALFLLMHEFGHIVQKTRKTTDEKLFNIVSKENYDSMFDKYEYQSKALEADADVFALTYIFNSVVNITKTVSRYELAYTLNAVFLFISTFDLSRRSIIEYQGIHNRKSSHPIPDLRAYVMMYGLFENMKSEYRFNLVDFHNVFEHSIKHCVRTFEGFAIVNGAFFIAANALFSIQHDIQEFSSQVTVMLIMQDELSKIEKNYRKLKGLEMGKDLFWQYLPLGFSTEDFEKNCEKELIDILDNKTRGDANIVRNRHESHIKSKLDKIASEMDKDSFLITTSFDFPDKDRIKKIEKEFFKKNEYYMKGAFSVIVNASGAKVSYPDKDPVDDNA